ncbi:MAG: hypothetical protein JWR16_1505 [Nevskia sp.]|nr:hypothetical protein [Nevskia sp.]
MYRTILLLSAALAVASPAFAAPLVPWPAAAKANAAGVCKQNIRDSVAQNFLTMTDSTELPADFYEKAAPNLNPMLDACDCALNKLEKQIGYDYYSAHQEDMPAKIQGLAMGVCKPKPPVEAEATP